VTEDAEKRPNVFRSMDARDKAHPRQVVTRTVARHFFNRSTQHARMNIARRVVRGSIVDTCQFVTG